MKKNVYLFSEENLTTTIKFVESDSKVVCIKDGSIELAATFEVLPHDLDKITIEWWVNNIMFPFENIIPSLKLII